MKRLPLLAFTLTITIGLIAVGCDSTGPTLESDEAGTLELRMAGMSSGGATATTAAVSDSGDLFSEVDSASVVITRTAIVSEEDSSSSAADSTEGGIKVLTEEDFTLDLTDLQSGIDTALAKTDLEQGTYAQLRLITADRATVVFSDTTEREAMVASGQQTGLKLNFAPFTIDAPDDEVQITVQWDAARSLKGSRQGNLVFTPVVQATVDTSGAAN